MPLLNKGVHHAARGFFPAPGDGRLFFAPEPALRRAMRRRPAMS